jgi:hypothetical protein
VDGFELGVGWPEGLVGGGTLSCGGGARWQRSFGRGMAKKRGELTSGDLGEAIKWFRLAGVGLWLRVDGGRARRSWGRGAAVCAGEEGSVGLYIGRNWKGMSTRRSSGMCSTRESETGGGARCSAAAGWVAGCGWRGACRRGQQGWRGMAAGASGRLVESVG